MRSHFLLLPGSLLIPVGLTVASCGGSSSDIGDGGGEATSDATMDTTPSGDSSSPDGFPTYDAPHDHGHTGMDSPSDVTPSESGPDGSADGPVDATPDVIPFDASDGGSPDVIFFDAPFDTGPLDSAGVCPVMQPVSGDVCFDLGITCHYGTLMAGAICTCQTTTHKWHCLFI